MKKEICGDTIQTGQLEFQCSRTYKHKGKHRTQWRAKNYCEDHRMISVAWPYRLPAKQITEMKE